MHSAHEWQAAGVYDPAAPDAAQRLELLQYLHEQGVDLASIADAHAAGRLSSVLFDRMLRPGRRLTVHDMAHETGMSPQMVTEVHRATGLSPTSPDAAPFTEGDIVSYRLFALASQFFSPTELGHFTRVVGNSMRRIADAAGEMFLRDVEGPIHEHQPGSSLEVAKANLAGIELAKMVSDLFEPLFRAHLEEATRVGRAARDGLDEFTTVPFAIGFADLSGFTSRSATMTPKELLELVMTFEAASIDLVTEHGGRVVKMIGDEVMFSTVDPLDACAIALGLVRQATTLVGGGRAGVAYGHVVASGGDVYGEVVNLAARITDIAVPGEVLVDAAVVERADGLPFEPAGRRQLKGFAEPVRLWSLTA